MKKGKERSAVDLPREREREGVMEGIDRGEEGKKRKGSGKGRETRQYTIRYR